MKRTRLLLAIIAIFLVGATVSAASYPVKPIKLLVPYAPGGTSDTLARIMEKHLGDYLPKPIVVVNMEGAGGVAGCSEVKRARPDGYTLLLHHTAMHIAYHMDLADFGYADFDPVALVAVAPQAILAKSDAPFNNLVELQAYAKERPNGVLYAMGAGGTSQFTGIALNDVLGIELKLVDVGGGANRMASVLGGHTQDMYEAVGATMPHVQANNLKYLAVLSEEREPVISDVPTAKEHGFDLVAPLPLGVYGPKGLPAEVIEVLEEALEKLCADPEFQADLAKITYNAEFLPREKFIEHLSQENDYIAKYAAQIKGN